MKAIILAAGYGTRLQRDLQNDPDGPYQHLLGMPKPLLPIGQLPLISHWMKLLSLCADVDQIFVLCNDLYLKQFTDWCKDWPAVKLISDGTTSNEDRIGAVAGIQLVVDSGQIDDDIMVIGGFHKVSYILHESFDPLGGAYLRFYNPTTYLQAEKLQRAYSGDTLFYDDFNITSILAEFKEHKSKKPVASLVLGCQCTEEETSRFGILEVDPHTSIITGFLEKPGPQNTKSRTSCPCFYLFCKKSLPLLRNFLGENKDGPLKARDATGNFVQYLFSRQPVFVHNVSSRFDVGALSSYIDCHKHFLQNQQSTS